MRNILLLICLVFISQQALAQNRPQLTPVQQKIQQLLQSDIRTDAEKARDRNRNPVGTLGFFGIQENMHVLELAPGGGWYTKILGPLLRDKGKLYIVDPPYYVDRTAPILKLPGLDKVVKLDWGKWDGQLEPNMRSFFPPPGKWDAHDLDMVLTFRNYHNFSQQARGILDKQVFQMLKPGGRYGVIDHTRRHMEPNNPENGRRVDPVEAIKEIQAAGFVFVDYSTVNYRPDDELRYEVGRHTVTGNSDRFTLLFMKPKED